jgi:hypothetical protein
MHTNAQTPIPTHTNTRMCTHVYTHNGRGQHSSCAVSYAVVNGVAGTMCSADRHSFCCPNMSGEYNFWLIGELRQHLWNTAYIALFSMFDGYST